MAWQDQGRQQHGYFGDGKAAPVPKQVTGKASYYPPTGHLMKNGQPYDLDAMTAAMTAMPTGTRVTVTRLDDPSKSVQVTVTDYGPFVTGRVIDLTPTVFTKLFGSTRQGVGSVIVTNNGSLGQK